MNLMIQTNSYMVAPWQVPGKFRCDFGAQEWNEPVPTIEVDNGLTKWTVSVACERPEKLKFDRLVKAWHSERGATSSIVEMSMCPAYQQLIGMGEEAVPLILEKLSAEGKKPDQWFWALKAITGADPVRFAYRGNFPRMARAWLQWGQARGYGW